MGDTINPDRHTDRAKGEHGNVTYGIKRAVIQLRKGEPFDHYALECYQQALNTLGYSEAQLNDLGARGELIRVTCRMSALSDLVWSGMLGAASVGNLEYFYTIVQNYGHRLDQARRAWRELLDIEREAKEREASILDYEGGLQAAQEVTNGERS